MYLHCFNLLNRMMKVYILMLRFSETLSFSTQLRKFSKFLPYSRTSLNRDAEILLKPLLLLQLKALLLVGEPVSFD